MSRKIKSQMTSPMTQAFRPSMSRHAWAMSPSMTARSSSSLRMLSRTLMTMPMRSTVLLCWSSPNKMAKLSSSVVMAGIELTCGQSSKRVRLRKTCRKNKKVRMLRMVLTLLKSPLWKMINYCVSDCMSWQGTLRQWSSVSLTRVANSLSQPA